MDEPVAAAIAFNECITRQDLDGLAALMTDDHTFIDTAGTVIAGKEQCLAAWRGFFAAFPDYRNVFDQVRVDADCVAMAGESHCADPRLDGPALWRATVRGGFIAEWRVYQDNPHHRALLRLS